MGEDDARAAAYYRLGADGGNIDAMINLGLMLESGEGVAQDLAAAAAYFRMAAERGDSFGKLKLGLMQQSGIGVVKNIEGRSTACWPPSRCGTSTWR
ncbi:tetratricopeptide repeat protein [Thauera sp. SDU_THAU2]|uniref:tetratricopeptide repeat protein n=1 Tax=Thauera sp. SDU_THAU2 TaxID=3136633 RepID=UPI004054DEDB